MTRPDRGPVTRRLVRVTARLVSGAGLAVAVLRELLRGSRHDPHGLVVESDGDDAWAG